MVTNIVEQLSRDEGRSNKGYICQAGYWTIGVGHNIETGPAIPEPAIDIILESDLKKVYDAIAKNLPWASQLGVVRHAVLVNMAFNIGIKGLLGFKKMLAALQKRDWETAAKECEDPDYIRDVGKRAYRLGKQIRTNQWQ